MLTMKARYAIRALTALARSATTAPLMTHDIARRENIPPRFLGGILLELRQHDLLVSRRGRGGGYTLRRAPDDITVAAVVNAVDGPLGSEPCVSPDVRRSCAECPNFHGCGPRLVLDRIYSATISALERTTIGELARRADALANLDPH
jgi:Rrf2 family protein